MVNSFKITPILIKKKVCGIICSSDNKQSRVELDKVQTQRILEQVISRVSSLTALSYCELHRE